VNIRRPPRPPAPATRVWALLAGLLTAVGLLGFTATTASAAGRAAAETRVGASASAPAQFIGPIAAVSAVQGRVPWLPEPQFVVATGVAAETAPEASNVLIAAPRQLQAKFKHAADFGVSGNYSKAKASEFSAALFDHINAAGTSSIRGTYRGDAVTHFVDPTTGLNVISREGMFVSGWKLNPDQLANVLRSGSLGGS
jgi:hypothetical protein